MNSGRGAGRVGGDAYEMVSAECHDAVVNKDAACSEDDHSVARRLDIGDDVRGKHDCYALRSNGIGDDGEKLPARKRIETRERFVKEEDRGTRPQGESQCDLALLTARELARAAYRCNSQARQSLDRIAAIKSWSEADRKIEMVADSQLPIQGD
jgi:hypothetical protein